MSMALTLLQKIRRLEGFSCDLEVSQFPAGERLPLSLQWVRIRGLARFWMDTQTDWGTLDYRQTQLLTSLYSAGMMWGFLLQYHHQQLAVYLALPADGNGMSGFSGMITAAFPGCDLDDGPAASDLFENLSRLQHAATLTGNPSCIDRVHALSGPPTGTAPPVRLEPVVRALRDTDWSYLVLAKPIPLAVVENAVHGLEVEELETQSAHLRHGSAEQHNNPQAQYYIDLIRAARDRHQAGQHQGMWWTQACFMTSTLAVLQRGIQSLVAAFAGPDSIPQPIRAHLCSPSPMTRSPIPVTRLNSIEVTALTRLPAEEFAGYALRDPVRFAVSPPTTSGIPTISIGSILDCAYQTSHHLQLNLADLCKHVLVAGVPGAGKTTTALAILEQLYKDHGIPSLVIDSGKCEYRQLIRSSFGDAVHIFTLGDETGVPFRFNLLEVLPGIHVQTQIDNLLSLLTTAYAWVTPMPDVLNLALHDAYNRFGWDLTLGINPLGYAPSTQPTLADLLESIRIVTQQLGYDSEITANIHAGLLTRLSHLTRGAKGRMLNVRTSVSMDDLLSFPTILETSVLGNDEEKAFIMGAILLRLMLYRQTAGLSPDRLVHVTLIEEAHRLLRASPAAAAGVENANPRAKAVETFSNMLAEMRAYGEGLIVLDQTPAQLAPTIIKNTAHKIAHRLVAADERETIGGAMNLDAAQQRHLATLRNGQAVVYSEGRESPYLVAMTSPASFDLAKAPPTKADIVEHMHGHPFIHPESPDATQPASQPLALTCAGCNRATCSMREDLYRYLATHDLRPEFQKAIDAEWHGLWQFGREIAGRITECVSTPSQVLCVLMNIATLAGVADEELSAMRRNLMILHDQEKYS